jgi:hypothetical protein
MNDDMKKTKPVITLDKKDKVFLMEVGLTAAGNGFKDEALSIFDALELTGGNSIPIAVGRCFAYAGNSELSEAFEVLKKESNKDKASEIDMAICLLAFKINDIETAVGFAHRCKDSDDPLLKNFGENAIEQAKERIKSSK